MTHSGSHDQKHSHRSGGGFFENDFYNTHLGPALFVIIPLVLLLFSWITNASFPVIGAGAVAVISLTLARVFRSPSGFFLSVLSVLAMMMLYIWQWTDIYLMPVLSAGIASNIALFSMGIMEAFIVMLLVLMYQKQLDHLKMKISYEWYTARTYRKFISLLVWFNIFLALFWLFGFIAHRYLFPHGYDTIRVSSGAAILALVCAGVPAVLSILKTPGEPRKKHRHSRRRRTAPASE